MGASPARVGLCPSGLWVTFSHITQRFSADQSQRVLLILDEPYTLVVASPGSPSPEDRVTLSGLHVQHGAFGLQAPQVTSQPGR